MEETFEITQPDITLDYNAIKTISVNGAEQTISEDKNVNINVPTKVSDLENDSGFIAEETDPTVPSYVKEITEQDISNWDNKSEFSGDYNDLSNKPTIPSELSDLTDDSTHRTVTDTEKTTWNSKSDFSGNYNDLTNKPEILTKDVNDLTYYELATATGNNIEISINSLTYVMTLNLKNSAGTVISTGTVDLPLESMVVSGSYDDTTKKIILTLQSGSTVEFSVADLVSGLQSEITPSNKLSSDLIDDTNQANKFVTASEKQIWNAKEDESNKVITISANSTNTEYPSALAVYNLFNSIVNGNEVEY